MARGAKLKHGMCGTREHVCWSAIKTRCTNSKQKSWKDYGGRGIRMCSGLSESFLYFFECVGTKPTPLHTIDRIRVNGSYSCGKCPECIANGWPMNIRWATRTEQNRNKDSCNYLEFNGDTLHISEWAEKTGISRRYIHTRVYRLGWTIEKALTTPSRAFNQKITVDGKTLNIKGWSKLTGLSVTSIHRRIAEGWTPEKSVTEPPSERHRINGMKAREHITGAR